MKNWLLLFITLVLLSCDENDTKEYSISIRNESDFILCEISIKMESFKTEFPDSIYLDSLFIGNETEKYTLEFDRTSSSGCGKSVGITLAAAFEVYYTQNNNVKFMYIEMEGRESDYVTAVINNETFYVIEN